VPSMCLWIILATTFMGSTLSRFTLAHHRSCIAHTTLICFRRRISPSRSRRSQTRGRALPGDLSDERVEVGGLLRAKAFWVAQQRPPQAPELGARRCSAQRVSLSAREAWATTWNLSKVIWTLGRRPVTP